MDEKSISFPESMARFSDTFSAAMFASAVYNLLLF